MAIIQATPYVVLDSHVHFYSAYPPADFFNCAHDNARMAMASAGGFTPVLCFTETYRDHWFARFAELAEGGEAELGRKMGPWRAQRTAELDSLILLGPEGATITLIAGRQLITHEKLEVLALGVWEPLQEGLYLSDSLNLIQEHGGIAVIPWAVGKWLGKRGKVVEQILCDENRQGIWLGDNSGRPRFWGEPHPFKIAHQRGIAILHGSDPLPLPGQYKKVCRFGTKINASLDMSHPSRTLKQVLTNPQTHIENYGELETTWGFIYRQTRLRLQRKNSVPIPQEN